MSIVLRVVGWMRISEVQKWASTNQGKAIKEGPADTTRSYRCKQKGIDRSKVVKGRERVRAERRVAASHLLDRGELVDSCGGGEVEGKR